MMINENDLRQSGVRLTPQRRMILSAIAQSNGHITAEDLHQRIRAVYPDVNMSTIYRNLDRLLDLRLVAVTDLGGGRVCYEALSAARHHHLICHQCGGMTELDDSIVEDLRRRIAQQYHFAPQVDHLAIWGMCPACQAEHEQATAPQPSTESAASGASAGQGEQDAHS